MIDPAAGGRTLPPGPEYPRGVADTVVFIPAWNEEASLPAVLEELRSELPDADVLVIDDGSTDATARVAKDGGAAVFAFGENRGLRAGIAAGYREAAERGYAFCGRVDADGQHPATELRRLLDLVRSDTCDVAVGSRFVAGEGYPAYRYLPSPARRLGTALLRRAMRIRLGTPFGDATSASSLPTPRPCRSLPSPTRAEHPRWRRCSGCTRRACVWRRCLST
jgi:glycosyltransferase involved in cell wall biosynthesis